MADNSSIIQECTINTPGLNKLEDDPIIIPSNSPRYIRKKRIPISQARKYQSQLSAQSKILRNKLKLFEEQSNEDVFLNMPENSDVFANESGVSSDILEKRNDFCKVSDYAINRPLKHCSSLPSMDIKFISLCSKSKSCDNLFFHSMETTVSVSKTVDSVIYPSSVESDEIIDSSSCSTVTENVNTGFISRRSSTSTLRERNNSQDSAFSFLSMSDIKETGKAAIVNSYDVVNSNWKPVHSRSRSDATSEISRHELDNSEDFSLPSSLKSGVPAKRKSIFEGQQMTVPTECFFPRPQQGQSLTSFLSSNEFNISAELDRENAHFCISDALISAIEHMKCSRTLRMVEEVDDDDSDEEIRILTQRIRIRKRERQREKVLKSIALLSDGKTDTTTSQSASPPLSSHSSDYEVDSLCSEDEDEVEDLELSAHTESNLNSMKENGLSLSMASLYSEADIRKAQMLHQESINKKFQESDSVNLTAESVALSLLRKFSEKHLPKASDLQWLVSEQEAPQRLLPLPDSWPISPDAVEEEYNLGNTRLRGNFEWAPPRSQIIFIIHPYMKRKEIIEKQKFRCAGCGMKIEKNYINRLRYCEYFGKYFCHCCHSNNLAYIPGRILWKWDFSKYYVSNIALDLLDHMYSDPLFNIEDINNNLYQKVRLLDLCRYYRMQLFYLKDFVRTCRKADMIQSLLEKQNHHIVYEPHTYSISDLVQKPLCTYKEGLHTGHTQNMLKKNASETTHIKKGDLSKQLHQIVNQCLDHVKHCVLCQAKGFICEICKKDSDIIFPFQFDKVILCQNCGSCFHKRCCKKVKCPRCVRIQERKKRLAECKSDEEL